MCQPTGDGDAGPGMQSGKEGDLPNFTNNSTAQVSLFVYLLASPGNYPHTSPVIFTW